MIQTGVGLRQLPSLIEAITTTRPGGLISIGTAGGLSPELHAGHLLLPLQVATENDEIFPVAPAWHARVCRQLDEYHIETGTVVSVADAVHQPRKKQQLYTHSGAVAVDMESAELARLASRHSIPFLVVRAIADPYDQTLPQSALAALTSRGDLHMAGLLAQLLRRPGEIANLIRLQANFRAAGQTLSTCCRTAGKQMCTPHP